MRTAHIRKRLTRLEKRVASARIAAKAKGAAASPTPPFVFQFPAVIVLWYDGDTCHVDRSAWPGVVIRGEQVRIEGINAPELRDPGGKDSRDFAATLAPVGMKVTLVCSREDKYGRLLSRIVLPDGSDFSSRMIAAGQAVPYMT